MEINGNPSTLPSGKGQAKADDFYIGWLGQAPTQLAQFLRKYVLLLLVVITIIAVTLALSQKKFSTSNFEYGTLTQVPRISSLKEVAPLVLSPP